METTRSMIISCPSCNHTGKLPLSAVPSSRPVVCPKCKHRFQIDPPRAAETPTSEMTCPKCALKQPESICCAGCGIVVAKYRPDLIAYHRARHYFPDTSPSRSLLAVLSCLNSRKIGNACALLLLLCFLFWNGLSKNRVVEFQRRAMAHNEEERQKAESGPPKKEAESSESKEDRLQLAELKQLKGQITQYGQRCITECRTNSANRWNGRRDSGRDSNSSSGGDLTNSIRDISYRLQSMQATPGNDGYHGRVMNLVVAVIDLDTLRSDTQSLDYETRLSNAIREYHEKLREVDGRGSAHTVRRRSGRP